MEGRPHDDDADLARLAKGGRIDAYEELVRRHQGIAQQVAYLITHSMADAEDAVQEGFVKAYLALDRFREDAPFRPWLLSIVGNEARNLRRSVGRRERLVLRLREERSSGEAAPSPEAAALDRERRAALLAAVEELPERARLVVGCRYLLSLSEAETAGVLGWPKGTVKSRLSRALERLRPAIDEKMRVD